MDTELNHPFNEQEKEVMDLLIQAHNKFCELSKGKSVYINHGYDWQTYMHQLQDVLIVGATMRRYPDYFNTTA